MKLITGLLVVLAAGPAFAGLALEIEVEKDEIEFEAAVTWVVRFVNRGTEEVRLFEPLHAGSNTFPAVRLVRKGDGRELRPYDSPFQSMVSRGLQGAVIRLAPGGEKEYRYARARFMAVDRRTQKADWYEPRPLPDGEYELRATYERADDMLPFNVGGFDVEERKVEGIFTGKIEAAPAVLRVGPPTKPHVRISVPDRGKAEVLVVLANPTGSEHMFQGPARFELGSKMYGSAAATMLFGTVVPAGETTEHRVDMRGLSWFREGRGGRVAEGLGEIVPSGTCHLKLVLGNAASDGIWARVPPVPSRGLEDVVVTATLSADRICVGDSLRLTTHVENLGDGDVALVHRLSFPKELLIRIEDATGRRRLVSSTTGKARGGTGGLRPRGENICKVADGLSWDRDRFDPAPGLTRKDLIWFEPKAGVAREVDLGSLLAKGLTPGRYRIFAGYRNSESGLRLGFTPDRLAATGVVWSEPVDLTVE